MVTFDAVTMTGWNKYFAAVSALSADDKPLNYEGMPIANGSVLRELDTGKRYAFDEENGRWCEQ